MSVTLQISAESAASKETQTDEHLTGTDRISGEDARREYSQPSLPRLSTARIKSNRSPFTALLVYLVFKCQHECIQMTGTVDAEDDVTEKRNDEECGAIEHRDKFNPAAYLDSFYKTASEDTAMQIVLFFLPGILYRLPQKVKTVLDLGAGPTVYLPIALRDRAENIYTSDYAPANRDTLISWIEKRSEFDWNNVCKWIANIEASMETGSQMQEKTRKLMRAVLDVNVHEAPVVQSTVWKENDGVEVPAKFQVVSTVFCLEYSCETLEAYFRAVRSACSLIEDGGFLIQGGVLDATTYNFGGKTFRCHRLKQSHIIESLKANNMATTAEQGYKFITHDDIFLLVSKKLE